MKTKTKEQCSTHLHLILFKRKVLGNNRTFRALLDISSHAGRNQTCVLRIINFLTPVRSLQAKHTKVD